MNTVYVVTEITLTAIIFEVWRDKDEAINRAKSFARMRFPETYHAAFEGKPWGSILYRYDPEGVDVVTVKEVDLY